SIALRQSCAGLPPPWRRGRPGFQTHPYRLIYGVRAGCRSLATLRGSGQRPLGLWNPAMGKASHYQEARQKAPTELSPERIEQFRSQVTREAWRYAAQGLLARKVKSHMYRLGNASEPPDRRGGGGGLKIALVLLILAGAGIAAGWYLFQERFASL